MVDYRSDETGKPLKLGKRKETSCFFVLFNIYIYLQLYIKQFRKTKRIFCILKA